MTSNAPDPELLRRYDVAGPRYTSYPTAPNFRAFTPDDHRRATERANEAAPGAPLSLYVHGPFCANPCFYCGCTRVITRDLARIARYVDTLLLEIHMQGALFGGRRPVEQLHFGGGTPTYFSDEQLRCVLERIDRCFGFVGPQGREFSIEIDPRTVDAARLAQLATMGFNRISLGVQDFDPDVQAAINRVQPPALTENLVRSARTLGLRSLSFDLIYGLPRQTVKGFRRTLDRVVDLAPDRIAIYGYAHLPAMFKAQRHIAAAELPDPALRLALVHAAVERLTGAGYVHIGMDHFARPGDELARARDQGRLQRNFQGYSTRAGLDLVGVGMSSISRLGGTYSQNARTLAEYQAAVDGGELATRRGLVMSQEDQLRAAVIERILCGREVHYAELGARFGVDVRRHLWEPIARLEPARVDGLVQSLPDRLIVTSLGRYFLRTLAMAFDAYLHQGPAREPAETRMARAV